MEVHVFVFEHRHGRDITAHASEEHALASAAEIARRDWEEARLGDPSLSSRPPRSDADAVELYFAAQEGVESYEICGCEIEGHVFQQPQSDGR